MKSRIFMYLFIFSASVQPANKSPGRKSKKCARAGARGMGDRRAVHRSTPVRVIPRTKLYARLRSVVPPLVLGEEERVGDRSHGVLEPAGY